MKACLSQIVENKMAALSILTLITILTRSVELSKNDRKVFSSENELKFNHIVVDRSHGTVFVAGINRLYQLDSNLTLVQSYVTGPKDDSPECSVRSDCPSNVKKNLTNNYNKALVIDDSTENIRLISCGSIFQGLCHVHNNISNISIQIEPIYQSVVANNETLSTIAFIGTGPSTGPISNVLYVAASITNYDSTYRMEMPMIASRSLRLNNMLTIAEESVQGGTKLVALNSRSDLRYLNNYVYGFSAGFFTYFLFAQMKSNPTSYVSKLGRICNEDTKYFSYTEIPIKCTGMKNDRDYNVVRAAFVIHKLEPKYANLLGLNIDSPGDVLFVVFSQTKQRENNVNNYFNEHSALCVYSLKTIDEIFLQNIEKCISTGGSRGLKNIFGERDCTDIHSIGINKENFCTSVSDIDIRLEGEMPVTGISLLAYDTLALTAVAAVLMDSEVLVFLGTNQGHLKKTSVENSSTLIELDDIAIDNSPVNPDMLFDKDMIHLYAMTENKVVKVEIQDCDRYETCQSCLASIPSHCGWCVLHKKCSLEKSCATLLSEKSFWIHPKKGKCSSITSITPIRVQREILEHLEINVDYFPNFDDQLQCVFTFTNETLITKAKRDHFIVNCDTPEPHLLPPLKQYDPDFMARVSLNTTSYPEFVSTNVAFFDCGAFTSCTACISSQFPCNWCLSKHQCMYRSSAIQNSNVILNSKNCDEQKGRAEVQYCPAIISTNNETSDIIVSDGATESIEFKTRILFQYLRKEHFSCQFLIEDQVIIVNATLDDKDILRCGEVKFSYSQQKKNFTVDFHVQWGGSKILDNLNKIQLLIYKCGEMSPNCGSCLTLKPKFNCGWCEPKNQCGVKSDCSNGTNDWLNQNSTCSTPTISWFEPKCGLSNDETNVTISGTSLGLTIGEVYNITIADVPCIQFNNLPKSHTKIVCHVNPPNSNLEKEGPVKIYMGTFSATSLQQFAFVNPEIHNIFPKKGPKSGGTELTIVGKHLDAGGYNFIEVMIHGIPCNLSSITSTTLKCCTGKFNSSRIAPDVIVKFGRNESVHLYGKFNYTDDPIIENIEKLNPKGIPAGGIKIHIRGKNLLSVQKIQFYVQYDNGKRYYDECKVLDDDSMNCSSPYMPDFQYSLMNPDKPDCSSYGFKMDSVNVPCHQLNSSSEMCRFLLYPNPTFKSFQNEIEYYNSDNEKYLSIDGEYINLAAQESDISIKIGSCDCRIASVMKNLLTCHLPALNDIPQEVVVHVGNFSATVGKLAKENCRWLLYAGYCCAIVLVVIIFILTVTYRKSSRTTHNLKKIRKQMDELELRLGAESKAAFTDLQTEITDLTAGISFGGIPFLEYRTYVMNVMFPNIEHSVILAERSEITGKEEGLRLFGQLINNKTFLLLFIQTLESNEDFSMNNRVYVASMIMMTLQNNMGYCTDILKTLLAQLIDKNFKNKRHPKLLLRQTESVVEKMLSIWFAFLLHKFLEEKAGEPLYKLFAAIRQYVNKGPIDAITFEARHTLSEDKIIRQHIGTFKTITIYVSIPSQTAVITGLEPTIERIPIKVLDCDTISQVKEKVIEVIYSTVHYSARPSASDLELEWIIDESSGHGKFLLDDDDSLKGEGEWRQLNTLRHYEIPNGSMFNLILFKNRSIHSASTVSVGTMSKSRKFSTGSWKPKIFRKSNESHSLSVRSKEIDCKRWHLLKPVDFFNTENCQKNTEMVTEIYLPRLLATKLILQKFVDDLFEVVFDANSKNSGLPSAIKYLFDFLDEQALHHGITDPDVVHTWKSNSLPLRFWINLIKNPNFVFDVHKSVVIDSCLSVIAQAFMDSCSISEHHLSMDSPTTKLLYAKDIPVNKKRVKQYYSDVKSLPAISDQDMNAILNEESCRHACEFNTNSSLYALYEYAVKYYDQLMVSLKEDEFAQSHKLVYKLGKVHNLIAVEFDVL